MLTVPVTDAAAGRMARANAHSRDDLPAPEGPVTDSIRPAGTVRSSGCTATTSPYVTLRSDARRSLMVAPA